MKKKLFFVLLSGSMFLNFNIADAKGSTEVTTFHLIGNYQEFYMFNYSPKEEEILTFFWILEINYQIYYKVKK